MGKKKGGLILSKTGEFVQVIHLSLYSLSSRLIRYPSLVCELVSLQISMLNKFSEMIRGNLTKLQRLKIVALVTIEVHARDVIEKMIKVGCSDVTAFEWLSQLRLYWDKVRRDKQRNE